MPNMTNIISSHNRKLTSRAAQPNEEGCNCRRPNECALQGKCQTSNLVYRCRVTTADDTQDYIGLTSTTFKQRYTNHKASFVHANKAHSTSLSSFIWKTKTRLTPWTGQSSVWLHPTVERWGCATSACLRRPASPSPTPRRPSTRETKLFQNAAIVTRCSWNIGSFFHSLIFTSTNSNSFLSLIFNLTLTYRVTLFKFPI